MQKFLAATAALLALAAAGSARAADMPLKAPPPPIWSWEGFYAGGNVGYSWGNSHNRLTFSDATTGAPLYSTTNNFSLDGVIGGLQIGDNWQRGNWVYGLEADIQGSGERGNTTGTCPGGSLGVRTTAGLSGACAQGHLGDTAPGDVAGFPVTDALSGKLKWFGTLRGRIGTTVLQPTFLAYVTGGLAYGGVSITDGISSTNIIGAQGTNGATLSPVGALFSTSATRVGWTIGAGLEGVLSGRWTGKVEYLYVDLGTVSGTFVTPIVAPSGNLLAVGFSSHITDNILRVGVNYHFDR